MSYPKYCIVFSVQGSIGWDWEAVRIYKVISSRIIKHVLCAALRSIRLLTHEEIAQYTLTYT